MIASPSRRCVAAPSTWPAVASMQKRSASGIALILTLVAVVTATIIATAFLHGQSTSFNVSQRVDRHAVARHIAESALALGIRRVQSDDTWRTMYAHGVWIEDEPLLAGTFTLRGEDEADSDLANNPADPVMLTAIGAYQGVTHTVRARVSTGGSTAGRVLLVIADDEPDDLETARIDVFRSWGWHVTTISQHASTSTFNTQCKAADVLYITDNTYAGTLAGKLAHQTIGVVCENPDVWPNLGLATSGQTNNGNVIEILTNDHPITASLNTGDVDIAQQTVRMTRLHGSMAPGAMVLAKRRSAPHSVMWAVDRGEALVEGTAAGRRVAMPFGGGNFDIDALNDVGRELVRGAITWASAPAPPSSDDGQAVVRYLFEEMHREPVLLGHWRLDDSGGGSGANVAAAVNGMIELKGGAIIDSYSSSQGAYSHANSGSAAAVATNATQPNHLNVMEGAHIRGDVFVGAGGNPNSIVQITGGASISGARTVQETNIDMSPVLLPQGMPATTNDWIINNNETLDGDRTVRNLRIQNNGQLTITGHVRLWVNQTFTVQNGGRLIIEPGASLIMWVDGDIDLKDNARVNDDSANPQRLTIFGTGTGKTIITNSAKVSGTLDVGGLVEFKGAGELYGSIRTRDTMKVLEGARVHLDVGMSTPWSGAAAAVAVNEVGDNSGAYVGATAGASGQIGAAAQFDGTSSHVLIPDDATYHVHTGSIAFWFNAASLSGTQGLIAKESNANGTNGHLAVYLQGNQLRATLRQDGVTHTIADGAAVSAGTWHHVVFSWGPSGMKLYRNGIEAASGAFTGGLGQTPSGDANAEPIVLGARGMNSAPLAASPLTDFFNGLLDDVRLYDGPMDAEQAARVFQGDAPGLSTATGFLVQDTGDVEPPLHLLVQNTANIAWIEGGGLRVLDATRILSTEPANKLYTTLSASNAMTLVVRFTPASTSGISTLVDNALQSSDRNFSLGQSFARLTQRLRTTGGSVSGAPELETDNLLQPNVPHHIVITYDGQDLRLYHNGTLHSTESRAGGLGNWSAAHWLALANAVNDDAPWRGTLHELAIYDYAMSDAQIAATFGSGNASASRVRWLEAP